MFNSNSSSSNPTPLNSENLSVNEEKMTQQQDHSDSGSLRETYSRLSKRSKLLQRLRKSKTEKEPSPSPKAVDIERSYSNTIDTDLPPLAPVERFGYHASTKNRILDQELADNIRNLLPARYQLFDDWHLEYSLEQHGISLKTLYRNTNPEYQRLLKRKKQDHGFADSVVTSMVVTHNSSNSYLNIRGHGYVVVVKDENNNKFGCFLNEHLKPMDHRRYYGNGECFLFKNEMYDPTALSHYSENTDSNNLDNNNNNDNNNPLLQHARFKAFMYTGINDNLIYSNNDFFAIGSSHGNNGLWLDKSLYNGVSCPCETFGNEVLCGSKNDKMGRFKVMGLEVWRIGDYQHV